MSKWRKIEDKLPGEYTYVLTLSVYPNGNSSTGIGTYNKDMGWQINWADDPGGYEDVTHWMRLPRPPKYMPCIMKPCNETARAWNKYCTFHANIPLERGY